MSPPLFILTITLYLVCSVASVVASFFAKNIPSRLINTVIIFHFLVLLFWFFIRNEIDTVLNPGTSNYLFLVLFCSGLLVAGNLLRKSYPIYLKIYFSLFLVSILVFIFSPSKVLGFIASGDISAINPKRYKIMESYYFIEQQSIMRSNKDQNSSFKVVREMGFFHKTLAREVLLPQKTDSILMLDFKENKNIFVRIYFNNNNSTDSLDLNVPLVLKRDSSNVITTKKPL